ncbi:MAG: tRNA-dihydrouridine synthase family protein [Oscillospiraceae bacterium]|nr:tRNA-dihydrouridine synthase family protein [Oscillospiraceae bacterium]
MRYELAPMEGVTTYLYRRCYHTHFVPMDRYFTPFIAPNMNQGLNAKERRDVLPEHNAGLPLVPQILTNRADHFLTTCRDLEALGYGEVNLNLGCPSGTVVSKGKGSGFLARYDELRAFLDEIFSRCPLRISIKTRVGRADQADWPRLLDLYRQYPCAELIVHPRIQKDFYRGAPRMDAFALAEAEAPWPLVYNGDLFTRRGIAEISRAHPGVETVMLGRGVISNPWLIGGTPDKAVLRDFHDELFDGYRGILYGDGPVLCKMKGVWAYLIQRFTNYAPYQKIIRKTRRLSEYQSTVNALFHNEDLIPDAGFQPEP